MYEQVKPLFDFPPLRKGKAPVELRALTHGIPPKKVRENLARFHEDWKIEGVDAWNNIDESREVFLVGDETIEEKGRSFGWWTLPEVIGDRFIARLLDAPRGTCIMMQNATQITFGIFSCRELQRPGRRKVICTDGEFPSVLHTLENERRRYLNYSAAVQEEVAFKPCVIEMGETPFDRAKVIAEIDDATAIVILSHVGFVRGERIPDSDIIAIVEKAHKHGALVCLDGYHALAGNPISVRKMGVDLYLGGLLKEGCGSSGCGFLYIREGLTLTPTLSGWFGDNAPFAFAREPAPHAEVRRRFLLGTTPVASLYHGVEGAKIMLQQGLDAVARDVIGKVQLMTDRFASAGISVVSPRVVERMSALVVLRIEEANLFREYIINERGICVDARRNQYIRMAPHIYNSPEDINRAVDEICRAYTSKEYLTYKVETKAGPVT